MKLVKCFPLLFFVACTSVNSQQPQEDLRRDDEFKKAIENAKTTRERSQEIKKEADEKTEKIVTEVSIKIVSLQSEVEQLKEKLDEANNLHDTIDVGVPFIILPISDSSERRR